MEIQTGPSPSPARQLPTPPTAAELRARHEAQRLAERRVEVLDGCPPDLATFAAGASALVYQPFLVIHARLSKERATAVRGFDAGGTQAVAFERDGRSWMVFRGSETSPETEAFIDWAHDLCWLPWGWWPRHLGFAHAWSRVSGDVLAWLADRPAGQPVVLCGHSLGGALALLAADDIAAAARVPVAAVITFGAPRVGTWFWTWRYHRRPAQPGERVPPGPSLRDVTWRLRREGDVVTWMPPIGYQHCGRPVSPEALVPVPSGPFPTAVGRDDGGLSQWRGAYMKARTGAYLPVHLGIDLLLFLRETAPEHFMRHYGVAFPDRPFADLPAVRAPQPTALDRVLTVVRWLITAAVALLILAGFWLAYRAAPELTVWSLGMTIVYVVAGYEPPPRGPAATPVFLRRPRP